MIPAPSLVRDALAPERATRPVATLRTAAVTGRARNVLRRRAAYKTWLATIAWLKRDVTEELPF